MTSAAPKTEISATASDETRPGSQLRLAYLISRYPAISHTFIYREIQALRQSGVVIEASSVNSPDRPLRELPDGERAEARRVFYVKQCSIAGVAIAHVRTLTRRPRGFFRGLGLALGHAASDPKRLVRWMGYFAEAVIVGDRLQTRGFQHLHVHFATEVANVGYLASRIFGIELSMTVHGPDEFYDVSQYALERKLDAATAVFCISSFTRGQLMKLTPPDQWGKFHLARLGVDLDEFPPQPFRFAPEVFQLLCIGRLVPAKGQHILLRAVEKLVSRGYKIRLRLAGDGPDRAGLERYCSEHQLAGTVSFEGAVNQDRIKQYIADADLFVLASFAEGVPVVLMEAMASEVACISTAITGIPELIRNGVDGLLVPSSDENALAEAIGALIENPLLRQRFAKAGRARIADEYEMQRNISRLRSLFSEHLCVARPVS
jgi:colanic acid/amylovoran biosynthesis glycosyltransferase